MEVKPGYKQTEVGVIPEDWEVCPVGQKGDVVTGKALAVNGPGKQRPYLRTKNVFDGRIDIDDVLTMPMTEDQFAQFRLRHGDVLLNEGQSLELVGRCAMYQDEYPEPCAIQNQLLRFRARAAVSGVFASYLFRHCQQTGVFARIALQTTSIAHLGGSRFERLILAWPKSELEQRAIAEALSDVDGLLGGLDRLIAKKRDLKQAAMQQLLTGQTRLPGFHGEWGLELGYKQTEVGAIPEEWEVKPLGELAIVTAGGTPSRANAKYWDGDIPWVTTSEVDFYTISHAEQFITKEGLNNSAAKLLPRGTLLMALYGQGKTRGKIGVLGIEAATNQACAAISLNNSASHEFIFYFLASQYDAIRKMSNTGNQENLNSALVRSILILLPPLPEQEAIAAVLSDMDAELAALEQRREKTRALKQAMMQELLTGRIRLL